MNLDQARSLADLATATQSLRLSVPLSQPLRERVGVWALTPDARRLLNARLYLTPQLTLGELLTTAAPPQIRWTRRVEQEVVEILAAELARALAPAEPVQVGVGPGLYPSSSELTAWAEEHDVADALALACGQVDHRDASPAVRSWLLARPWTTVAEVLTHPATERGSATEEVRRAIVSELMRRASEVREAIEEEARTPRKPPTDALLGPLYDRLMEARAAQRAEAPPRLRERHSEYKTEVIDDPAAIRLRTTGHTLCSRRAGVRLTVALQAPDVASCVTCDCPAAPPSCSHRVAALDLVLDVLDHPETPLAQTIRTLVATPAWERALGRLDAALAPPVVEEDGRELGWLVELDGARLMVEPVLARPKKTGGSSWRTWRPAEGEANRFAGPVDRVVQSMLGEEGGPARPTGSVARPSARVHRSLLLLVGHSCVLIDGEPFEVRREPWTLELVPDEGGVAVDVRVSGEHVDASVLHTAIAGRIAAGVAVWVDPEARRLRLLEIDEPAWGLLHHLAEDGAHFPHEALPELLRRLPAWSRLAPIRVEESLRGRQVPHDARVILRVEVMEPSTLRVSARVRPWEGGEVYPAGSGSPEVHGLVEGEPVWSLRDLEAERARVEELVGPEAYELMPATFDLPDPELALLVLERLQGASDVVAEWVGKRRWKVGASVSTTDLTLRARDGLSWFAIDGDVVIDQRVVPLSSLLAAVREKRSFVRIDDERWARISEPFRDRLREASVGQSGPQPRIGAAQALVLEALVEDGALVDENSSLPAILTRLREARELVPDVPVDLVPVLRPYQVDGFTFLARLAAWAPGAILADDMGLGKTVQALALLVHRASEGPALVVAPTSVGFNWIREAERFAGSLRLLPYRGVTRSMALSKLGPGDVLVTSYDIVARDVGRLERVDFATVILDEAQAVKNAATQRWKACKALKRRFTIALTGTPVENRLEELWALCDLTLPSLLGDARAFRTDFLLPQSTADADAVRGRLQRRIRPFLLRRTKAMVAPELPSRTVVDVRVDVSAEELRLYETVRQGALVEVAGNTQDSEPQSRIRILAALTALRRVACHPGLHDATWTGPASKLARVRELVAELRSEGHRALLFSQFTSHLALVRKALEADGVTCRYLDGATPEAQRRTEVDAFQAGEGDVFLISLKAGGTGLNLTAATYVLHLDPWWNPAVEDQATDRAHRIGQTRPVTVYRIVARGTVEEKILSMHEEKRALVASVLDGSEVAARLTSQELWSLLAEGGGTPEPEELVGEES